MILFTRTMREFKNGNEDDSDDEEELANAVPDKECAKLKGDPNVYVAWTVKWLKRHYHLSASNYVQQALQENRQVTSRHVT